VSLLLSPPLDVMFLSCRPCLLHVSALKVAETSVLRGRCGEQARGHQCQQAGRCSGRLAGGSIACVSRGAETCWLVNSTDGVPTARSLKTLLESHAGTGSGADSRALHTEAGAWDRHRQRKVQLAALSVCVSRLCHQSKHGP
jgi:hypothetical protein